MTYDVYLYKWALLATRVDADVVAVLRESNPDLIALEHIDTDQNNFVFRGLDNG